jgi:hypothetical protein
VRQSIQRLLDESAQLPTASKVLSLNKHVNELVVKPHSLSDYAFEQPDTPEEK